MSYSKMSARSRRSTRTSTCGHDQAVPLASVVDFGRRASYLVCLLTHADPTLAAKAPDTKADQRTRWDCFVAF